MDTGIKSSRTTLVAAEARQPRRQGGLRRALALVATSGIAVVGTAVVVVFVVVAIVAPLIAPANPFEINSADRLLSPSLNAPMGTDFYGRDSFSRIIYGARASLWVSFLSVLLAVIIGGPLGILAGFKVGRVDNLVMRSMDILFAFPPILLAIVISAVLGPGMTNAAIAIAIVYIPRMARMTRGPVLSVRSMEYVEAATAIGSSQSRNIVRHILPNIMAPLLIQISLMISTAILAEAALSFLGLGVQPPQPSWGSMLNEGRGVLEIAPWLSIFPGIGIVLVVLGFNLLGDGLRDVLDPRLRK